MKLFGFLKGKDEAPKGVIPQQIIRPECDINKTQTIVDLFKVAIDQRDDNWSSQLYSNVQTASFACGNPQTLTGPDGFPYFILRTPEENKPFESFCIRNMKDDFLLDNGWGVVINPRENGADWVFSYGDIVNLHINNEFYSNTNIINVQAEEIIKRNENILLAQPSESYLPVKVRQNLRAFLEKIGNKNPQIMMVSRKIRGEMIHELAFNIFREDFSSPDELTDTQRQISWFLPKHYIILSVPKGSDLAQKFADL